MVQIIGDFILSGRIFVDEKTGVAAVNRALSILSAFDGEVEPLSVSELARRTGLYKSTTLRLIESLKAYGYIIQLADGRYQLGPMLLRLGAMYQRASRMEERIMPVLERMTAAGSESPSFYIRHDAERRLCLFRVDSGHSTLDRVKTGLLLPLRHGAAGRVFLAHDDVPDLPPEMVNDIRRKGYAVSFGETDPDCAAVAAPVFGHDDEVVGVLSISGPLDRFTEAHVAKQVGYLLPAARALTNAFGGRFPASGDVTSAA
ncbi:IclR family transcriptional regulator [Halovulum dunhuangense]|uniref:IclR family transcriptional regulator n=1 Tax=Halovulum dunhuangense TaxID=1505036 RepID=A0A849L6F3_9RHOB|nr:IclR family transcriptional regulator [Halovulum dunhuangense]NNU82025.1 IclR family transcriptional regulator [Halovulum dunhuangense]